LQKASLSVVVPPKIPNRLVLVRNFRKDKPE
jgi:hypothetical protein